MKPALGHLDEAQEDAELCLSERGRRGVCRQGQPCRVLRPWEGVELSIWVKRGATENKRDTL